VKHVRIPAPAAPGGQAATPTIWGLSPQEVHDRFWACRGVAVVRRGVAAEIPESAELYLLLDPHVLVMFRLRDLVELLSWLTPRLLLVRLRHDSTDTYRERVAVDDEGRLLGFERIYDALDSRQARIGLTSESGVAALWQRAASSREGWQCLRNEVSAEERQARSMPGRVFDTRNDEQVMAHLEVLLEAWSHPDSTIPRVRRGVSGTWTDRDARVAPEASIVGRVWVGAGRTLKGSDLVVGPAILWDAPGARPPRDPVRWRDLQPLALRSPQGPRRPVRTPHPGKRLFDVLFSLVALLVTLPLYPLIMLAIWIEDGWPVFFAHRRETLGGREFPCFKFRSMRRDAESTKAVLLERNVADGPQFFVRDDPRSTRVGRILRATQLDEIPQFWNVLLGHMSVVGPRPSPRHENQYCPAWREARLSVRPGITGLWQIRRTRAQGLDFQEWIKFDLEYVERMSWTLDLWILWRTCVVVLTRALGR
jgi:lipopolysaccharide/colanic/teichoic acid biosynthesis glycosyltransferase